MQGLALKTGVQRIVGNIAIAYFNILQISQLFLHAIALIARQQGKAFFMRVRVTEQ